MKEYSFRNAPVRVYGAPYFYRDGTMKRFEKELAKKMFFGVTEWKLDVRSPGARVAFRTDAQEIRFVIDLEGIAPDPGMSLYSAQSADVFIGGEYRGQIVPVDMYNTPRAEGTFKKEAIMQDVLVFLPRNEAAKEVTILLPEEARIEAPTPYAHPVPVMFYGSSITEGAHAGKPSNAYVCLLSRWLDFDFVNFGISGSARGELFVADHLNRFEKSVFVLDYDYNAPDEEHLEKTHQAFFQRIREQDPDLPVIILSGPWLKENDPGPARRREIIKKTYADAVKAGDKKVWFVDGGAFFGDGDREICSADRIHPNDHGMYLMARALVPVMKQALAAARK